MAVVSAFAQTLRRYTSLNHLAQAARAVLQNTSQINQMLSDLNRVDFANVQVNMFGTFLASLQKYYRAVLSVVSLVSVSNTLAVCLSCVTGTGVVGVSV